LRGSRGSRRRQGSTADSESSSAAAAGTGRPVCTNVHRLLRSTARSTDWHCLTLG